MGPSIFVEFEMMIMLMKIFSPLLEHGSTGEKREEKEVEELTHMQE